VKYIVMVGIYFSNGIYTTWSRYVPMH